MGQQPHRETGEPEEEPVGSATTSPLAAPPSAADLLAGVEGAMAGVRSAQQQIEPADGPAADDLAAVEEELDVLHEQIAAQLAAIDAAMNRQAPERPLERGLALNLPVAVLVTDRHGTVIDANPAASALFEVPLARLDRKPVVSLTVDDDRHAARDLLRAALRTGLAEGSITARPRGGPGVTCQVTLVATGGTVTPAEERARLTSVIWVFQPRPAWGDPAHPDGEEQTRYHAALVELCRITATDSDLLTLLKRVSELAAEGLPGATAATVVLGHPRDPTVVASSSALAQAADGVQYRAEEGPAFDAVRSLRAVWTGDLFGDPRWPRLTTTPAARRDVQSCLALPVVQGHEAVGLIVVYAARKPDATGRPALGTATIGPAGPFVAAVESLVRDVRTIENLRQVRDQLAEALTSRSVIDQAKGMIMMTRGCSADEAFAALARMSSARNRKVRDLARDIVAQAMQGRSELI